MDLWQSIWKAIRPEQTYEISHGINKKYKDSLSSYTNFYC